jgi:glycosyltransferase involved in cell wall biosynthesis
MFILEAMARKNCVVSTRVGGIPKLLAGGRGVLVEPGDVAQLAAALSEVIRNRQLREQIAAAGYSGFEHSFSAKVVYPKVERLWSRVLAHPRPE